jgi:nucleoside-diphosphate-sugar epimerase
MKKVLVTGATGFVGSALLQRLGLTGQALSLRNNPANCLAWLDRADCVVHLAARVHIMNDVVKDPVAEFRASNVDLTVDLARQAAQAGVRRFVFISSVKVNGEETALGSAFTASDVPLPQDPYGVSKMEAEQALARISAQTGLEVVIIRPPLVYALGFAQTLVRC